DADHAEQQNDGDLVHFEAQQYAEVNDDDDGDKTFEDTEELCLGIQIRFAGLVDKLAHFAHGIVHGHVLQAYEDHEAENEAEGADQETAHEEAASRDTTQEGDRIEAGQFEVGFASRILGQERRGKRDKRKESQKDAQE